MPRPWARSWPDPGFLLGGPVVQRLQLVNHLLVFVVGFHQLVDAPALLLGLAFEVGERHTYPGGVFERTEQCDGGAGGALDLHADGDK